MGYNLLVAQRSFAVLVLLALLMTGCAGPGAWDLFRQLDQGPGGPADLDVLTGLLARYTFDSVGGLATDSTGNGNDGTPNGSSAADMWVDDPVRGGVLELNGTTEDIMIPALAGPLNAVTISLWVNLAGMDDWEPIYTANGWVDQTIHYHIKGPVATDGRAQFSVKASNPQYMHSSLYLFNAGDFNSWHHLVAVHDIPAGTMTFYFDGTVETVIPIAPPVGSPIAPRLDAGRIGGWDGGRWFHGRMDDVRFYKWGLTAEDVAAVYEATR
jgi:hypothetical protein